MTQIYSKVSSEKHKEAPKLLFIWSTKPPDCQFLGVEDFAVFARGLVEKFHIAAKYQKKTLNKKFLRSFQWCDPNLPTMLRCRNIQVSYVAFQKNHTVE